MRTSLLAGLLGSLLVCLLAFVFACDSGSHDAADGGTNTNPVAAANEADAAHGTDDGHGHAEVASAKGARRSSEESEASTLAKRHPGERPLPAFQGRTLSGDMLSARDLLGQRLLLLFFNPGMDEGKVVAEAVAEISKLGARNNFRTVGVAVGSSAAEARRVVNDLGIDFPVIDDSTARIANIFGLRGPILLLGADREGYLTFAQGYFATEGEDAIPRVRDEIAKAMRIATASSELDGDLLPRADAPHFKTVTIDDEPFDFASLDGKPVVLVFFLHTCSHCHEALEFMKGTLASMPEANRPVLLGISVQNRPISVRTAMGEAGLDYFPILMDPDGDLREAYGVRGGVPDIMLVTADRQIVHRVQGWREDRDPPLLRMYLAKLAGTKVPMLLNPTGFTGNDACAVCHEVEAATWSFTSHSRAYDTLVTHGADRDTECIGCHVVGYDEPGGYSFDNPQRFLEDVGCENCHGRGGPHLSPGFVKNENYEPVCATCHNKEHSLGFEYVSFSEHVSHSQIAGMTAEERLRAFGEGSRPRSLMPTDVDYVGSAACVECHQGEWSTWEASPHGQAIKPLVAKGEDGKAVCLECHTTGYDKTGGFDPAMPHAQQPDLARVGCESCHGPGGDHVKPEAKKIGSIISLGDKCDSCVILQICGSCHDPENDPDFEFNVDDHIERQRHGTIEAGTGKSLNENGAAWVPTKPEAGAERELARALAEMAERG